MPQDTNNLANIIAGYGIIFRENTKQPRSAAPGLSVGSHIKRQREVYVQSVGLSWLKGGVFAQRYNLCARKPEIRKATKLEFAAPDGPHWDFIYRGALPGRIFSTNSSGERMGSSSESLFLRNPASEVMIISQPSAIAWA